MCCMPTANETFSNNVQQIARQVCLGLIYEVLVRDTPFFYAKRERCMLQSEGIGLENSKFKQIQDILGGKKGYESKYLKALTLVAAQ